MSNVHRQLRTLSIGGATYDLFLSLRGEAEQIARRDKEIVFSIGDKVKIERVIERCGGGASNTSVGFSRLGCEASFCGVLGEDQWGTILLRNLKREKVDTTHATIVEGETSSFSAILSLRTGERTILYATGINEHLHDVTFAREAIADTDLVYLNHLCEASCVIEDDIIEQLREHPSVHFCWNPGGSQIRSGIAERNTRALLERTSLLLLNREEAALFTGEKTVEGALARLRRAGVQCACITDGARGAHAADRDHQYFCPAIQVTVVDATGAGDAFGCAASITLLEEKSLPAALIAGTLNAASVLATIGAQPGLLTHTEILSKLAGRPLTVEIVRS